MQVADYVIREGNARVTVFASQGNAGTFDFQGGDIGTWRCKEENNSGYQSMFPAGYIPASHGHYVENTGNTTLRFLEVFKTATFQDVSLTQVRVYST